MVVIFRGDTHTHRAHCAFHTVAIGRIKRSSICSAWNPHWNKVYSSKLPLSTLNRHKISCWLDGKCTFSANCKVPRWRQTQTNSTRLRVKLLEDINLCGLLSISILYKWRVRRTGMARDNDQHPIQHILISISLPTDLMEMEYFNYPDKFGEHTV